MGRSGHFHETPASMTPATKRDLGWIQPQPTVV